MTETRSSPADDLHRRAEERARGDKATTQELLSPDKAPLVLHELRVHQIELEIQNEELRRAQAELEASRARYFDLYDLAPVGYFTLSEQGLMLEANLTAAGLLGVERSALVKQPLTRFIFPEDQDIYYRHRRQLFEAGAPQVYELRLLRTDAAPFWARVEATAAQDADGAPVCRAVVSDITQRKHKEQQLRLASEELKRTNRSLVDRNIEIQNLYHTLSHELKTPLTSAREFVSMVMDGLAGPLNETQLTYLGIAKQSCDQLRVYINDLPDVTRLETGKMSATFVLRVGKVAAHPGCVLVVDDDAAVRHTSRLCLKKEGFQVMTASRGTKALKLMHQRVPDLVILDLAMPDLSGPDVLRKIRKEWGSIPIIVHTGQPEGDLMSRALEFSPFTLLAKPCPPPQLVETVRAIAGWRGGKAWTTRSDMYPGPRTQ